MSDLSPIGATCQLGAAVTPCALAELDPLLEFLASGAAVSDRVRFPRGTLLADGRLDLCKQRLGPAGTAAVAGAARGHPQVRHLLLGADGLGDGGAAALADLAGAGALETLYLGCNGITAVGAASLAGALADRPGVTGLWIKRNPLGDAGVRAVARMLPLNPALRVLDLAQVAMTAAGLGELVEVLTTVPTGVQRLYLCGNRFGPDEAPLLAALLRATALRHLYLSVNFLGDAGVLTLADALRSNRQLQSLSLASNGLGPAAAEALAEALHGHPTLRSLELGQEASAGLLGAVPNAVGDRGAAALADALPTLPALHVLDLSGNGVTDRGAGLLAHALAGSRSVMQLPLGKGVSSHRCRQLEMWLERNRADRPAPTPDADLLAIQSVYRTAPVMPSQKVGVGSRP